MLNVCFMPMQIANYVWSVYAIQVLERMKKNMCRTGLGVREVAVRFGFPLSKVQHSVQETLGISNGFCLRE